MLYRPPITHLDAHAKVVKGALFSHPTLQGPAIEADRGFSGCSGPMLQPVLCIAKCLLTPAK